MEPNKYEIRHASLDAMTLEEELEFALQLEGWFNEAERETIIKSVQWVIERRMLGKDPRWAAMEKWLRQDKTTTYR